MRSVQRPDPGRNAHLQTHADTTPDPYRLNAWESGMLSAILIKANVKKSAHKALYRAVWELARGGRILEAGDDGEHGIAEQAGKSARWVEDNRDALDAPTIALVRRTRKGYSHPNGAGGYTSILSLYDLDGLQVMYSALEAEHPTSIESMIPLAGIALGKVLRRRPDLATGVRDVAVKKPKARPVLRLKVMTRIHRLLNDVSADAIAWGIGADEESAALLKGIEQLQTRLLDIAAAGGVPTENVGSTPEPEPEPEPAECGLKRSVPIATSAEPEPENHSGVSVSAEPPPELRDWSHWVVWKYGPERQNGKRPKVPYNPETGRRASVTNPKTWSDYDTARARYDAGAYDGLGACLTPDESRLVVVDLDGCRDPETGALTPEAERIISRLDSYTEVSPSRTGVHIWALATLSLHASRKGGVEIYDRARFICWTGELVAGSPAEVHERTDELRELHREVFGPEPEPTSPKGTPPVSLSPSDEQVIARARLNGRGAPFARLYDRGDITGYDTPSEADLRLCGIFATWTSSRAQIDRLFRSSGLMRPKWERADYRERTLDRALAG